MHAPDRPGVHRSPGPRRGVKHHRLPPQLAQIAAIALSITEPAGHRMLHPLGVADRPPRRFGCRRITGQRGRLGHRERRHAVAVVGRVDAGVARQRAVRFLVTNQISQSAVDGLGVRSLAVRVAGPR